MYSKLIYSQENLPSRRIAHSWWYSKQWSKPGGALGEPRMDFAFAAQPMDQLEVILLYEEQLTICI